MKANVSSGKTRMVTHSTRLTTRSTRLSTCSTRFSTDSTRLSIRLFIRSICLRTRNTRSTICRSFYN